jgi:hypothetical protein
MNGHGDGNGHGGKGEEENGVKGNASIFGRDGLTGVKRSTA